MLLLAGSAHALNSLDELLQRHPPPSGVVIEIVEGDESALATLIPKIHNAIEQLRARNPAMEFAVVTHGREQFALQTREQKEQHEIHTGIQSLVASQIPVHVCATHASWEGVTPEDFPDYVSVSATGPGQIQQYEELGFELLRIETD